MINHHDNDGHLNHGEQFRVAVIKPLSCYIFAQDLRVNYDENINDEDNNNEDNLLLCSRVR